MVTTTYFPALRGYKFGLGHAYFLNPNCVGADWLRQFTASQPFQCVTITIMNGWRRWTLEFILHHHHRTLAFESWVMKILVHGPYISYQDRAGRDWFSHFTASQPFQSLFISILNGLTWLRLVYGHRNGHNNLFSSSERVQIWIGPCLLFEPKLCGCWLIEAIHSIPTIPMCHYNYNEWLEKVDIGIHPPPPSSHSGFWVMGDENFGAWTLHFIPR